MLEEQPGQYRPRDATQRGRTLLHSEGFAAYRGIDGRRDHRRQRRREQTLTDDEKRQREAERDSPSVDGQQHVPDSTHAERNTQDLTPAALLAERAHHASLHDDHCETDRGEERVDDAVPRVEAMIE